MESNPSLESLATEIKILKDRLSSFEAAPVAEQDTTTKISQDLNRQIPTNCETMGSALDMGHFDSGII